MVLGRTVPWTDWDEWTHVRRCLFADDTALIQRGINRVIAWRARGRVPIGVDATALLIETKINDQNSFTNAGSKPIFSETSLRLQYSLAIVRLVNGIADSSQRGSIAASVASLANAAGMPWLLVDLRHEATHNELPTLAALRRGAEEGLRWLEVYYWDRQTCHVAASLSKIGETLQRYISLHIAAAAKGSQSKERQSADEDGNGDENGDFYEDKHQKTIIQSYDPVSGRKQRESLLTELKVLVPSPCAKWLIDGALKSVKAVVAQCPKSKSGMDTVYLGIRHACNHILPVWTSLRGLLLMKFASTKFEKLSEIDGEGNNSFDLVAWEVWINTLLPTMESSKHGLPGSMPHMSQTTIRSILARAMASYSAAMDEQLLAGLVEDGASFQRRQDQGLLRSMILRLSNLLDPQHAQLAQYCQKMVKDTNNGIQPSPDENVEASSALTGKGKHSDKKREEETNRETKSRKWRKLDRSEWHGCAIGMLTDGVDPNGRLSQREARN
jgi:hypothetical protein